MQFKVPRSETKFRLTSVTPEVFCYSFPGMLSIAPKLATQGIREQRLVIARGPSGCLDGTIHSVMKHLVVVLGKRNEHERGDRGKFIQLLPENLSSGKIFLMSNHQQVCFKKKVLRKAAKRDL
jgi:hypothetical protein